MIAHQKESSETKALNFDIKVQPDDPNHAQQQLLCY